MFKDRIFTDVRVHLRKGYLDFESLTVNLRVYGTIPISIVRNATGHYAAHNQGPSWPGNYIKTPPKKSKPSVARKKPVPADRQPWLSIKPKVAEENIEELNDAISGVNLRVHNQVPSSITSPQPGSNIKALPKMPPVVQTKPHHSQIHQPWLSKRPGVPSFDLDQIAFPVSWYSKKQKVTVYSIEELNAVITGVNLREKEQLPSVPNDYSQASEPIREVGQEEAGRLVLQRAPLQRKLAKIMSRCGIENISDDVEHCLSQCVEERLRRLMPKLISMSKLRVDMEGQMHQILITSDVRHQILVMNQKAKEDLEKKQAEETEEPNQADGNTADRGKIEKVVERRKPRTARKYEDDKWQTKAANIAARVAFGGNDMLLKWQLMAEQAQQKQEGGVDVASASQLGKDAGHRGSTSRQASMDNQYADNRGPSSSAASGTGKAMARTITVKDVIAVLEREPQMMKSTFLYRLYERR